MKTELKCLCLHEITSETEIQQRSRINDETVVEYMEVMKRDGASAFPPLDVFFDGEVYWLSDGFHRLAAAGRAGLESFDCKVRRGTRSDAMWFACGANQTHGLRRSREDTARAVRSALRQPGRAARSNADIGRHVGVSDKTVAKYRRELEATSEVSKSEKRIGRDGRTTRTGKIGRRAGSARFPGDAPRSESHAENTPASAPPTDSDSEPSAVSVGDPSAWDAMDRWLSEAIRAEGREPVIRELRGLLARHGIRLETVVAAGGARDCVREYSSADPEAVSAETTSQNEWADMRT